MHSQTPCRGTRRLCWFASTALTSVLLPLSFVPAAAQQTAAPDVELREVEVNPPPSAPRRPAATPSAPATRSAPTTTTTTAPTAANAPVVVSPTAIATPATDVASSVTVVTSQQIEQQQLRSAPDAINLVPGLNIVQAGGPGGQTSIFLRGTNSNHTKFLIDGIDVSDPSNPNRAFDLGQLLTGDIERIEVLRGPQSGLYGSDALGGVVSVITKKGEGPPKVTYSMEGGTFNTLNENGSLSGGSTNYNYSFNVNHFRAEDFRTDGLRSYAKYRDLGMSKATNGLLQAHVIRLVPPCDPAVVSIFRLAISGAERSPEMSRALDSKARAPVRAAVEALMRQARAIVQRSKLRVRGRCQPCSVMILICEKTTWIGHSIANLHTVVVQCSQARRALSSWRQPPQIMTTIHSC